MPSFIVVKGRKGEYRSTSQRFTLSFNVCRSRQMDVLRYRIKSKKFVRVVTEDELSYSQ